MEIMVSARYKKGTHESEPVTVLSICAHIAHATPKRCKTVTRTNVALLVEPR